MLTVKATFNIFGYQCREVDVTPALGLALVALVVFLVGKTTMGV
jgi:hypothetical protein